MRPPGMLLAVLLGVLAAVAPGLNPGNVLGSPAEASGPAVNGEGSSFVELEMKQWQADVAIRYELNVNFLPNSSDVGRDAFTQGAVDFAASDVPYNANGVGEHLPGRPFEYVTTESGGLAFMYNLNDTSGNQIRHLNLTPETACRLLTERQISWDDPEIQADNPGVSLPHIPPQRVLRDRGGTNYIMMQYCAAGAPAVWARFIQAVGSSYIGPQLDPYRTAFLTGKPQSTWPNYEPNANYPSDADTQAALVSSQGNGSIADIATGFAIELGFPVASVKNSAGFFVQPTSTNVIQALAYATTRSDGTLNLAFSGPAANAYFPSTYVYTIVPTAGFDAGKGAVLARFLNYAVTEGQSEAVQLGYAPLTSNIVGASLLAISKIPGAPPPLSYNGAPAPPGTVPATTPGGQASQPAAAGPGAAPGGSAAPGATGPGRASTGSPAGPGQAASASRQPGAAGGPGAVAGGAMGAGPDAGGTTTTAAGGPGAGQVPVSQPAAGQVALSAARPIPPSRGAGVLTLLAGAALCALVLGLARALRTRTQARVRTRTARIRP